MRKLTKILFVFVVCLLLSSCDFSEENALAKKQEMIYSSYQHTLNTIKKYPNVNTNLNHAYGWAIFTNKKEVTYQTNYGYGLAHNNLSNKYTFMKMKVPSKKFFDDKKIKIIFVFRTKEAFENFVKTGLLLTPPPKHPIEQTKMNTDNSIYSMRNYQTNVIGYLITKKGFATKVDINKIQYWKDASLNNRD
ncbi:hypothetical protein CF386_09980 [Paraphotobacterium marinum]|uniref:Lipoprotein n=1 Tax=Paraphotobacterium marinum TaxID=1755811 RepID=A0A220VGF0_9GAMM|nr:hypothetical protein [Paraphotobacterium marinum]ASK79381.1 hypothetical protein CF386_09980 [Paraphotobacterium marinum]